MIAADQLAPAFNPAAWNEVIEGHDPAAHAIAGLEHRRLISRGEQLMRGGSPAKPAPIMMTDLLEGLVAKCARTAEKAPVPAGGGGFAKIRGALPD